ncbi:MAG: hypothetical protein Q7J84_15505 [Sulfuricaulis sp.]|nr:hypothetical protein [Sulfuricaulis sp.]
MRALLYHRAATLTRDVLHIRAGGGMGGFWRLFVFVSYCQFFTQQALYSIPSGANVYLKITVIQG